jgi:hypothetical protein
MTGPKAKTPNDRTQLDNMDTAANGAYPATRLRRTRQADWSRRLVRQTYLTPSDLIWPMFVMPGIDQTEPVTSMPGVERFTIDRAVKAAKEAQPWHSADCRVSEHTARQAHQ